VTAAAPTKEAPSRDSGGDVQSGSTPDAEASRPLLTDADKETLRNLFWDGTGLPVSDAPTYHRFVKVGVIEALWQHETRAMVGDFARANPRELASDEELTCYGKRVSARVLGSRLYSYQLVLYEVQDNTWLDHILDTFVWQELPTFGRSAGFATLLPLELDGVSNVIYNLSYLSSAPAKFIHVTKDFVLFGLATALAQGFGALVLATFALLAAYVQLGAGFIIAMFMLFLGPVVGTMAHPLQTLANLSVSPSDPVMTNLIVSLWDMAAAIFGPLWTIFSWRP
jgi:hypothetical protein